MAELPILEQRFRMPNITVGKAFKEKIQAVGDLNGELELCSTQIDSALEGLSINDNTFMAEGSVNKSGDYTIELYCYLLLASGEKQKVKGMLKVSVIPDPHSLWKNLPSDHNAPFHKSDSASDSCKTDSAHFIAASVRGRSHAHKGIHREDDITIHCSSSQWSIMAIADGAGSCQYSRRGSELATLCATETLKETLNDHYGSDLEKIITESLIEKSDDKKAIKIKQTLGNIYQQTMVKAVHNVALAIQEEVNILNDTGDQKKDNNPICFKDFSTTLLLVAYKPVSDGYLIFSFWVGDGVAVIYDKGKSVTLLGEPDSGEYAGQTRFLDYKLFEDSHIYNRIRIQKVSSMTALILATDGISDAKFDTEKQLSSVEQWDVLWNELEPIVNNNDLKQGEKNLLKW
ncbi:MAG: protein phosphatase 2C domain-containing protein, partial [Gammaproteobacteria bacterium]|nr:protein phosphatase 2C domain-containing protein [Gammaproteobacteria bacterium]